MDSEKFCLRWNDFETNISKAFKELRDEKDFFDVTLACDDNQIEAHKVILSACSPFFRNILRRNPHQHPLLYLKGVKYTELLSVLNFMYMGEVNVAQDELNSFLSVAEDLRVKGLTQSNSGQAKSRNTFNSYNHTKKEPPEREPNLAPKRQCPNNQSKKYNENDENVEIQEVIPVKTEPKDSTPTAPSQLIFTAPQPQVVYQTQEQHSIGEAEPEMDQQGTVALDESYGVDEAYDYQYEEEYENGVETMDPNTGMSAWTKFGANGSSDLNSAIHAKMSKTAEGEWQCNDCFRTSRFKTNILEHIEATHVESSGYNCDICFKFYKNRHSLRNHKNLKHKEMKNI